MHTLYKYVTKISFSAFGHNQYHKWTK